MSNNSSLHPTFEEHFPKFLEKFSVGNKIPFKEIERIFSLKVNRKLVNEFKAVESL